MSGTVAAAFASLAGMASAAFLAATLIPAQSEAVFVALLAAGSVPPLALFLTASLANTAGSCLNWALGTLLATGGVQRLPGWLRPAPESLAKASALFTRLGWPALLLSWVPVIGDPLTLAAGVLRYPFLRFVALVGLAKAARYAVLWAGWAAVSG
jgi:membrane protein YqaA with SNARE-associated domain